MRILVVGSGGREHALCWAIATSPLCQALYCAPGNAGIAREAECVDIAAEDLDGLVDFCRREAIDLAVIGPEGPLVAGLVDRLEASGVRAFGPSAAAAELEGSKAFTKQLCDRMDIPTAAYGVFTESAAAQAHIDRHGAPIVVKADGLAAGKGVVVAQTVEEAKQAVRAALADADFGAAGQRLVIEECLVGPEVSFFALVDGRTAVPLASAQDHKRAFDGDAGPNTGGMGAFSPSPLVDTALQATIMDRIIKPTVKGMADLGRPFKGVLYAGLILTAEGPKLLEYNTRFGDPECQVLVRRLAGDLVPALVAACEGGLNGMTLSWRPESAVGVVMAARGYPGSYEKGTPIAGIEGAEALDDCVVFHAGTRAAADGGIEAAGGRVLCVTALGGDLRAARDAAYLGVGSIDWPGGYNRMDIAAKNLGD